MKTIQFVCQNTFNYMKKIIFLLLFFVSTSCCKIDPDALHGYYHFSYHNHAWLTVHSGWMVDENGSIRGYNNPEKWNYPDSLGYISRYQLEENLSYCDTVIGRVSPGKVSYYNLFVYSASKGTYSEPKPHGADMGARVYYCYWYDRSKDLYRQVMLNQDGDWICHNTDNSAKKIYKWFRDLVTN